MSDYVREKVLRVPVGHIDISNIKNIIAQKHEDWEDDFPYYLESEFPDIFDYATVGKLQISPTYEFYIDYVIDREYGSDGEWGKTRALYDSEKKRYLPIFQQIDPNINMDYVRLVEFCWYNSTDAPDYYDDTNDSFYDEV